jgi:short-subunit dehydrogenase
MSNQSGSGNGIAVVTGASAGLGKIYADRLAKRKYDLLLVARRRERLDALASELGEKYGVRVQSIVADLGNLPDLKKVSDVIGTDERVTLLVNCAGTSAVTPLVNMTLPDVDRLMDVNMRSLTHLSLAVLPGFLKRNQGTIINIGSVLSFFIFPGSTAYSGTKAQVMLFTLGLQQEVAGTDVRVQLVMPASTATEIWDVAGIGLHALNPATVMTAEDCVDAALAGLDQGEAVTLPSVEDMSLWKKFDVARISLFEASQTGRPASRYGLAK